MEILDSRQLKSTKPRKESAQPNPRILSFAREPKPLNPLHLVSGSTQTGDHSGTPTDYSFLTSQNMQAGTHPREYKTKEQHRLVYRHVGCALNHAADLLTSFRAIHDTFIGKFTGASPRLRSQLTSDKLSPCSTSLVGHIEMSV